MILDSNILIGYLNGDESIISTVQAWRMSGAVLFASTVSATETLSLSTLTPDDIPTVDGFLADFIIIPVDLHIARVAGALRQKHRLSVPDAIIVATAVTHNLPLATRDKKIR